MVATPVQRNVGVANAISTTQPMQDAVRSQSDFRGQTVTVSPQERNKISLALSSGIGRQQAAGADLHTLSRRALRQGQGASMEAAKRIRINMRRSRSCAITSQPKMRRKSFNRL